MDRNKIEREIEFHRKMANKMLAKYGGMVGDMKCIEHMNKADELEKKLNEEIRESDESFCPKCKNSGSRYSDVYEKYIQCDCKQNDLERT